ncbi:MAG: hypothetical protein ACRD16_12650 [Thermoanaerobaculia bacterium]
MKSVKDRPEPAASNGQRWGRPPALLDQWSRVTMVLYDRQIIFLDRLITDIRASTGAIVKRTDIVRALIDGLIESNIDLTSVKDESDLKRLIGRLGHVPAREEEPDPVAPR